MKIKPTILSNQLYNTESIYLISVDNIPDSAWIDQQEAQIAYFAIKRLCTNGQQVTCYKVQLNQQNRTEDNPIPGVTMIIPEMIMTEVNITEPPCAICGETNCEHLQLRGCTHPDCIGCTLSCNIYGDNLGDTNDN